MVFNTDRKPAPRIHNKNPNPAPREPVARRDWSSQMGAYEQAELIRQYWWGKGRHNVLIAVVQTSHRGRARDGLYGLKSNLVGGLPPAC